MSPRKNKMVIEIPVDDWDEEYIQDEPQIATEDDLINLLRQRGYSPQKIGRLAIIARERGNVPDTILPPNKLLLNAGAAVDISAKVAARKVKVELPNGAQVNIREFVAPVPQEPEEAGGDQTGSVIHSNNVSLLPPRPPDAVFVPALSQEAVTRATDYLMNRVPGYIQGWLAIIAANGGDVAAVAGELKARIDEMVARLG